MRLEGFKKYIYSEEMNPTMDKNVAASEGESGEKNGEMEDYFAALADELGINWGNMKNTFEKQPFVLSHFQLGKGNPFHKLSPWEIVPGSMTPAGAQIRIKPLHNNRAYLKNRILDKSGYQDNRKYFVSRNQLMKMLSSGWPTQDQSQGQMPPGMGGIQ